MISGVCLICKQVIYVVNLTKLKGDFTLSGIRHVKISIKQLGVQFSISYSQTHPSLFPPSLEQTRIC